MKILSLQHGHNSSAAYSDNGEIKCILSEERFTRIKNHHGFPVSCLKFIVDNFLDGSISNIEKIAIVDKSGLSAKFNCSKNFQTVNSIDLNELIGIYNRRKIFYKNFKFIYKVLKNINYKFKKKISYENYKSKLYDYYKLPKDKIVEFDHHLSHAATFSYFKNYNSNQKYLVFTLDGEGDFKSSTVNILNEDKFEIVSSNNSEVSLGYFYLYVTAYLGLKPGEHEYKVMGMAPYAKQERSDILKEKLKKLFWLDNDGRINCITQSGNLMFEISKIFKFCRFDEIARSTQEFLEEIVLDWIKFWINKTKVNNIVVGGGVFMNVKLNKRIHELKEVKTFFSIPSCTDDSLPIGGLFLENKKNNIEIKKIHHLYFGRSYSERDIDKFLDDGKIKKLFEIRKFINFDKLNEIVAQLLFNNEIVARFYGVEEFGARALGNRSILCNPSKISNLSKINTFIKKRDFWMPFTPSILQERVNEYYFNPKNVDSSYMSCTFESTELAKEHLQAAIHPADFTIRPQIVRKEINKEYHDLIQKFNFISGIGAVLNTSFNLSGYPNVSTPKNAVDTVINSEIKYLILGNNLLVKL